MADLNAAFLIVAVQNSRSSRNYAEDDADLPLIVAVQNSRSSRNGFGGYEDLAEIVAVQNSRSSRNTQKINTELGRL